MWGRGENVAVVRSGAAPWVAGAAGLEGRAWLAPALAIVLSADLQVPFARPDFELMIDGSPTSVHAPLEIGGLVGVGLLLRVP